MNGYAPGTAGLLIIAAILLVLGTVGAIVSAAHGVTNLAALTGATAGLCLILITRDHQKEK